MFVLGVLWLAIGICQILGVEMSHNLRTGIAIGQMLSGITVLSLCFIKIKNKF